MKLKEWYMGNRDRILPEDNFYYFILKGKEHPTSAIAFKCSFRDIDRLYDYELDRPPRISYTSKDYITDIVFYLKDLDYKVTVKDYYESAKNLIKTLKSVKYCFSGDYEGNEFTAEPYKFGKDYEDFELKRSVYCKNEKYVKFILGSPVNFINLINSTDRDSSLSKNKETKLTLKKWYDENKKYLTTDIIKIQIHKYDKNRNVSCGYIFEYPIDLNLYNSCGSYENYEVDAISTYEGHIYLKLKYYV